MDTNKAAVRELIEAEEEISNLAWKVMANIMDMRRYQGKFDRLRDAISAAETVGDGWISVEQELPAIPDGLNLSEIVMGLYESPRQSFDFMRYNKRTSNWRVLPDAHVVKNKVVMWHALPTPPDTKEPA